MINNIINNLYQAHDQQHPIQFIAKTFDRNKKEFIFTFAITENNVMVSKNYSLTELTASYASYIQYLPDYEKKSINTKKTRHSCLE